MAVCLRETILVLQNWERTAQNRSCACICEQSFINHASPFPPPHWVTFVLSHLLRSCTIPVDHDPPSTDAQGWSVSHKVQLVSNHLGRDLSPCFSTPDLQQRALHFRVCSCYWLLITLHMLHVCIASLTVHSASNFTFPQNPFGVSVCTISVLYAVTQEYNNVQ